MLEAKNHFLFIIFCPLCIQQSRAGKRMLMILYLSVLRSKMNFSSIEKKRDQEEEEEEEKKENGACSYESS